MRARNLTAKGRKNREGDGTGPDGGEEGAPGGSEHRTGAEGVGGMRKRGAALAVPLLADPL